MIWKVKKKKLHLFGNFMFVVTFELFENAIESSSGFREIVSDQVYI